MYVSWMHAQSIFFLRTDAIKKKKLEAIYCNSEFL